MARLCKIKKENERIKCSTRAYAKRQELKNKISSPLTPFEEKMELVAKLNKAPRNESKSRVRNRCRFCGRSRSIYKKFGLCRIHLREAFVQGFVPGLRKSSW